MRHWTALSGTSIVQTIEIIWNYQSQHFKESQISNIDCSRYLMKSAIYCVSKLGSTYNTYKAVENKSAYKKGKITRRTVPNYARYGDF